MKRALTLGSTLLAFALSGCFCDNPTPAESDGGGVGTGDGDGDTVGDGDGDTGDGDGDTGDGDGDTNDAGVACLGLESLSIAASTTSVTLDGTSAQPVTFTAEGTDGSGSVTVDVDDLSWSASRDDDTDPGEVEGGEFTPNPGAGGVVTITATDGCVSDSIEISLALEATVGMAAMGDDWTAAPTMDGTPPSMIYPSHQTYFPRNIHRTLFQWAHADHDAFRLVFTGPNGEVTIYTDGVHELCEGANEAACWEADDASWEFIAGSNAGEEVTVVIEGLDRDVDPAAVRRSEAITLQISKRDVRGAVFYWSTTSKGIRRANVGDVEPEDYLTGDPKTAYDSSEIGPDGEEVKCVACHTVSRDGQYLAAPVDPEVADKSLWILEVSAAPKPTPLITEIENTGGHMFATFSPDNEYVVATNKDGEMWMIDRATGAFVEDLPLGETLGTHPDWSPTGEQLVFATGKGDAPGDASIALMSRDVDGWGEPEVLVAPPDGQTNVYPMFSPDGEWIAYSQGSGGHGDDEMLLFITSPLTGEAVELTAANRTVNNLETDGLHQNAGPTFAPSGDLYWVAFNSKREYGVVLEGGTQQIWVAAIDPAKLGTDEDPSFPAFRLPFQGLEENNHRAFWALDVRVDVPPPDGGVVDAGPEPDGGGDAGVDAGVVDAGPEEVCALTLEACDPSGAGCCSAADYCDTTDDGETYSCIPIGG